MARYHSMAAHELGGWFPYLLEMSSFAQNLGTLDATLLGATSSPDFHSEEVAPCQFKAPFRSGNPILD
jgi:hypothetical protein